MSDKNMFIQDVGDGGRIRLPKEVMKALDMWHMERASEVELTLSGEMADGTPFSTTDFVRVHHWRTTKKRCKR